MLEVIGCILLTLMFITVIAYLIKYILRFIRHITTPSCSKCKHYNPRCYNPYFSEKCFVGIPEKLRKFNGAWYMAFEVKDIRGTKYCKFETRTKEQ